MRKNKSSCKLFKSLESILVRYNISYQQVDCFTVQHLFPKEKIYCLNFTTEDKTTIPVAVMPLQYKNKTFERAFTDRDKNFYLLRSVTGGITGLGGILYDTVWLVTSLDFYLKRHLYLLQYAPEPDITNWSLSMKQTILLTVAVKEERHALFFYPKDEEFVIFQHLQAEKVLSRSDNLWQELNTKI